ncbi:MAG: DMT family transporter [Nitriliruptor sp.]|nr:MAG: DMT family transporter [Nitriliruptor sp.]
MAALLALLAAVSFGVSDVAGAVASRRASALAVSFVLLVAGFPVLAVGLVLAPGEPSVAAIGLGALAGGIGTIGLVLYLRSMAVGPVGVISPISALVGVAVPVSWGVAVSGEVLSIVQVVGVLGGILAVVMVAWSPGASLRAYGSAGSLVALIAGTLFGLYFVILDATPAGSGLWPLVGARASGTLAVAILLAAIRRPVPPRSHWPLIVLSGATDASANILFLLATRSGLLSLASLLSSLYPVVALLLARAFLQERLTPLQGAGVVLALCATTALIV